MDENFNHRKGSVFGRIERGNVFPVPPASGSTRPIASPFGVLLAAEPKLPHRRSGLAENAVLDLREFVVDELILGAVSPQDLDRRVSVE